MLCVRTQVLYTVTVELTIHSERLIMVNEEHEENEHLTITQSLPLKKIGNSRGVTFPAAWLKTLRQFELGVILFSADVQRTRDGRIQIVLEKVNPFPKHKHDGGET